ncbi:aminopeptidase P family protein [bacterium]|nr:aminopeptidase P family protein [candidate division CSSED10-310 bacterium]
MNVIDVQDYLRELGMNGWLLTDYQLMNPHAIRFLGLDTDSHRSRRWFYFIPTVGAPVKIVHAIEPHVLKGIPGNVITYFSRTQLVNSLRNILAGHSVIAMEYSPEGRLPSVSRVDAGTIEMIRSCGVTVVSSGDLLQLFTSCWDSAARLSHHLAANVLRDCVDAVWDLVRNRLTTGDLTEHTVQTFIMDRFAKNNCRTNHPPIVAIGAHSADPHYNPDRSNSDVIRPDQLLLIDMWCKVNRPGSVYADITWTAWTGDSPPDDVLTVFSIVRDARNLAIKTVCNAFTEKRAITGADIDRSTRTYITQNGFGDYFTHRTGHSLDTDVHGSGANLDSLESEDERLLLPGTGFTIEPGIYLPDHFGIRSEINIVVNPDGKVEISGLPIQEELTRLIPTGSSPVSE